MKTGYNRYTGKPTDSKNFYIDPEELSDEIRKSQKDHRCTDNLAAMAQKVLRNVLMWPKFRYQTQDTKDEIGSYSMYRWLKTGIYSCNPDGNCFSYLTQSIYSNCLCRLMQLKKKEANRLEYEKRILDQMDCWVDNQISKAEEEEEDDE